MKKGLIVKCKICEKEIYIPQYRIGRTKFCSFQCKNKNTSLHPIKPKTGRFVECFICKKKVWKYKSRECFKKTFCSRECFRKFDYGGKVELKCKFCGKIYFNYKSQIK